MASNWFVYVIQSTVDGTFYVGHTHDVASRLIHHNDGWTKSTKSGRPWKLVYREVHGSKGEAMIREKQIKSMKSRQFIERLIKTAGGRPACPDSLCRGSRFSVMSMSRDREVPSAPRRPFP